MEKVVSEYLKNLKIPVSEEYLKTLITCHSQYPYLISVADTLENLGICYSFLRIDKESIPNELFPFLMHIDNDNVNSVVISCPGDLKKHENIKPFWSGLILKVEPTKYINDPQNEYYRAKEKKSNLIFTLLVCTIVGIETFISFSYLSGYAVGTVATNLIGLVLGCTLFTREFGMMPKILDTFCSFKKLSGCAKVVSAVESKISLSGLTFIYFIIQFLCIVCLSLILKDIDRVGALLFFLSIPTLPVIVFSLIYQCCVIKIWCKVCLLIDLLLVGQICIFYTQFQSFDINFYSGVHTVILSIFVIILFLLLVIIILNLYKSVFKLKLEERRLKQVFWDPDVFNHYLFKQPKLSLEDHEDDLKVGCKGAPVKLILVIDLFCPSCWVAFQAIAEILLLFPEKVNLVLRFSSGENAMPDLHAVPEDYILAYFIEKIKEEKQNVDTLINLLNDWFKLKNFKEFKQRYSLTGTADYVRSAEQGKRNREWIKSNNIDQVPMLFINGYKLPKQYRLNEMKILLHNFSANLDPLA